MDEIGGKVKCRLLAKLVTNATDALLNGLRLHERQNGTLGGIELIRFRQAFGFLFDDNFESAVGNSSVVLSVFCEPEYFRRKLRRRIGKTVTSQKTLNMLDKAIAKLR